MPQCAHQLGGGSVVQLVGGFVQKQYVGVMQQGSGKAEALLFAAREDVVPLVFGIGIECGQTRQAGLLQYLGDGGVIGRNGVWVGEHVAQAVVR